MFNELTATPNKEAQLDVDGGTNQGDIAGSLRVSLKASSVQGKPEPPVQDETKTSVQGEPEIPVQVKPGDLNEGDNQTPRVT